MCKIMEIREKLWKEAFRSQVKIIYNARKNSYYKEELLDDSWEILSDADDSWCWGKGICAGRQIEAAPQSVLILGRK